MRPFTTLPSYSSNKKLLFFKRVFRNPNKLIIVVILVAFLVFCISPIFFLPDLRVGLTSKAGHVYNVYHKMKESVPEFIIPPPPFANDPDKRVPNHSADKIRNQARIQEDRERLSQKIKNEVLERPVAEKGPSSPTNFHTDSPSSAIPTKNRVINPIADSNEIPHPLIRGGEDKDPEIRKKRDKITEMTLHGWSNYKAYAWGTNELKPISKRGHNAQIFGQDMGATIVDAMDLLYIMGLDEEFDAGRQWIKDNLNFDNVATYISVFETNIRFIGGLLTLYSFTGDPLFKDKAYHIGQKLLPAFDTPTGIPHALINVAHKKSKNFAWASQSSILSEFGTLHLEFAYLSSITGDPVFLEKALKIRDFIDRMEKPQGLYPNYLNPSTGHWGQRHVSIGALGDSFYEYLLKAFVQSGYKDKQAKRLYQEAVKNIDKWLVKRDSNHGLVYVAERKMQSTYHKMDHLACFSAGMFGLGSKVIHDETSSYFRHLGSEIATTCHESYKRTATGIGPESFHFDSNVEAVALRATEKYYILRPEVIEAWFVMWRLTHDQKYRDWSWDAAMAIDKYCRVKNGFSGIKDVYSAKVIHDDVQQSYLFAETFKYLYLIFSDDTLVSLDHWVFNTEGHPLPIHGHNTFYRPYQGPKSNRFI